MPIEPETAPAKALARRAVEERGTIAAAIAALLGVAILGPRLTRLVTPRTRTQKLKDEAAFQTEAFRRRARKSAARARKSTRKAARRLGGGRVERYV